MDNNIGKKLDGRYELLELIGVGGMADIYRARDIQEDRIVAVKILKTEFAGSEEFLRRFRNESKAIALLSHPNIVKIYDVGFTDKVQFIVMEYVDGITLTDYIEQQGVLKWRDAVHFTVQVLRALQHAHDRGIVHRDVKSSNVMLLRDGTIKVMDFGIARFNRENNKTMSEKTIGSVHYISPEQARGDITDERSDIYSVGVALYEMLTGRKPFDGDTPVSIALMHMQSNPRKPTEINETIPEGLEQIVLRAMQKEPQARYQTAGEMISDLEEFKKNPGIVFDYKYNSTDGTAKFAGVNPAAEQEAARRKAMLTEEVEDYDDDDDEDEYEERRSPLIPILFAVGAAFVIVTVFLVLTMVSNRLGLVNSGSSENTESDDQLGISMGVDGTFPMPNLVGETWDTVNALYGDGKYFILDPVKEWSEYAENQVFYQEFPATRRIKKGTTVTVKVSKGIRQVEIQDLTDRTVTAATQQLEKDGFKVRLQYNESEDIAKDHVISTIPAAHDRAQVGSTVILIVSLGPPDKPVYVPKLTGIPIEEAVKRCEEYNLIPDVEYKDSEEEKGKVLEQSIAQQTMVDKDTHIKLIVSSGNIPELTSQVVITLPQSIKGKFRFEYYVDGKPNESATETRDLGLSGSKTLRYDVKGQKGEIKYFAINVTSLATNKEGTYIEVKVDFTGDKPTQDRTFIDSKIFETLQTVDDPKPPQTSETSEPQTSETSETDNSDTNSSESAQ